MKTWTTQIQLNGDERTVYCYQETQISDELYEQIQKALAENKPLDECEFASEIEELAEEQYNENPPARDDDPDDDDEEFDGDDEENDDELYVESITICDPGEQKRFAAHFLGRKVPEQHTGEEHEEDFEVEYNGAEIITMQVTVKFDENGVITEVGELTAQGLQSSGLKYDDWEECEPYFHYAMRELDECDLSEEGEDWDDDDEDDEDDEENEDELENGYLPL